LRGASDNSYGNPEGILEVQGAQRSKDSAGNADIRNQTMMHSSNSNR